MIKAELDGYQLIKKIKLNELYKIFPIVAVTAQAMLGDKEKYFQVDANNYILKPINIDGLLQIRKHYLAGI